MSEFEDPTETPAPTLVPTLEEQKEQRLAARDAAVAAKREAKKEEKAEKCVLYQETAWGTQVLNKLERIYAIVDPKCLFSTSDSVNYDDGRAMEEGPDSSNGTVLKTSLILPNPDSCWVYDTLLHPPTHTNIARVVIRVTG